MTTRMHRLTLADQLPLTSAGRTYSNDPRLASSIASGTVMTRVSFKLFFLKKKKIKLYKNSLTWSELRSTGSNLLRLAPAGSDWLQLAPTGLATRRAAVRPFAPLNADRIEAMIRINYGCIV